jgi:hypothetical protein
MKQKDIALIAVIAIVSAVASLLLSGIFISSTEDRKQKVEVVQPIISEFQTPPTEYFNDRALNPTQIIQIGEDPNSKPFGQ